LKDVTLYTRRSCSECGKAKDLLNKHGIPYTEQVIDETITREEVLGMFPTARALPVITTSEKAIFTGLAGLKEELNA
jgi:glutaredoxin